MQLYQKYRKALRPIFWMLAVLAAIQITSWLMPPLYAAKGMASYAPLHTVLELFSIAISTLVFAVVWNSYDKDRPSNFTLLASIFMGVAILDCLHTLSYHGMPDFITPSGPEKAIDFWLAARALSAFGLLAVAFLPWRRSASEVARWPVLAGVMLLVGSVAWVVLLHPEWTPRTYIPGQGLTPFKVISEFAIIALYALAALRFLQQMRAPRPYGVVGLFTAVCVMALSEVFFTLYSDVTDIFNLLGHAYKVIAYGFIYNSVFIDSIKAPYLRLSESRNLLQSVIEAIPARVFWKNRESRYLGCNTLFAADAGVATPEHVIGKYDAQLSWHEHAPLYRADDQQVMHSASPKLAYEEPQTLSNGLRAWLRSSKVPLHDATNEVIGVLGIYEDITAHKRAEHDLRLTQAAIDKSKSAFFWLNPEGMVLYANDHACHVLGYGRKELVGKHIWDFDQELTAADWLQMWSGLKKSGVINVETRHQRKDGTVFPVEMTGNYIASEGEEYSFTFVHDITERKQAELTQNKLARARKLLSKCNSLLVHAESESEILAGICKLAVETGGYQMAWVGFKENDDAKSVRPVAQSGHEEGYLNSIQITWADTVLGQGPTGTAIRTGETVINQNILTNPVMAPWLEAAIKRGYQSSIALPLGSNNRIFGALTIYAAEPNAFLMEEVELLEELAGDLAYGIQTLRTRVAHETAEKKLEFLAHHDPLTALPNRVLLRDRFDQAAAFANREKSGVAVLFLDLDNFKHVNDSLGHATGDQLLVQVAKRMHACIRDTDTICRRGGDEFIILLTSMHDLAAIEAVARKIIDAFIEPFHIGRHVLSVSFSIGISLYPNDHKEFDVLLQQADTALYQAKDAGRNTYRFFSGQMGVDAVERLQLQSQLHDAIKNNEFLLHYQPQLDMESGRIVGAEALLRWQHPGLGVVSPAKFIPLAEESGLIIPIGQWVLNEACRQAQLWRKTNLLPNMSIAVNLSALQFRRGNILETVTHALDQSGLPPSQLELELTESILLSNLDVVMETLRSLKEIGVKISIDDFGTGYSSLSYLKRLAVDKLKIDRSFVHDMAEDSANAAIVHAIVQLGHTLQLTVIAEGVENEAQSALLRNYGCDEVQGYLYSRPMPAMDFADFCTR